MFSAEIYEIFKNILVVASESLRNDFAEQILTLQLSKILPRTILKKKMPSSYREKNDALGTKLAIKSSGIHLIYFYFYSVATGMTNMSPNIFISNVLLKNRTERNE